MTQTATQPAEFAITPDWVKAGEAIFIVDNGKGTHYTYCVKQKVDNKGDRLPVWFVGLLTDGRLCEYTYIGCLDPRTGGVRLTRASECDESSTPYRVVDWSLKRLWADVPLPEGYSINGAGRCGRCGRQLTRPEGVNGDGYRFGYGPECWDKIHS